MVLTIRSPSDPRIPAYNTVLSGLITYKRRHSTLTQLIADSTSGSDYAEAYTVLLASQDYLSWAEKHKRVMAEIAQGRHGIGIMDEEEEIAMDPASHVQKLGNLEEEVEDIQQGIRYLERVADAHEKTMNEWSVGELKVRLREFELSQLQLQEVHSRWEEFMSSLRENMYAKKAALERLRDRKHVGEMAVIKLVNEREIGKRKNKQNEEEKKAWKEGEEWKKEWEVWVPEAVPTEAERRDAPAKEWLAQEQDRFQTQAELEDVRSQLERVLEKVEAIKVLAYPLEERSGAYVAEDEGVGGGTVGGGGGGGDAVDDDDEMYAGQPEGFGGEGAEDQDEVKVEGNGKGKEVVRDPVESDRDVVEKMTEQVDRG